MVRGESVEGGRERGIFSLSLCKLAMLFAFKQSTVYNHVKLLGQHNLKRTELL